MGYCQARYEQAMVRRSYRAYVTDSLRLILENTAVPAAYVTAGEAGKLAENRWIDMLYGPRQPEETRTPEEVTAYMLQKLRE